jgi:hypothetical protein
LQRADRAGSTFVYQLPPVQPPPEPEHERVTAPLVLSQVKLSLVTGSLTVTVKEFDVPVALAR